MFAAYFCFVNFGMTPGEFDALSEREKLVIIGFIEKYQDALENARKEAKK